MHGTHELARDKRVRANFMTCSVKFGTGSPGDCSAAESEAWKMESVADTRHRIHPESSKET